MALATYPRPALKYKALSRATALRAVREAEKVRGRGGMAVAAVVAQHQMAQASLAEQATTLMLADQAIDAAADAPLVASGFVSEGQQILDLLDQITTDYAFARLVESLVQDAGRAAQSVSQATRPDVGWTRVLTPPSCSRCAVLAGRVYRYSDGFLRHPQDDCTTIPVRDGDRTFVQDPVNMARRGLVSGLSKADLQAVRDGADFNRIVNVRRQAAGLRESGTTLYRRGRMTPEAIYRTTGDDRAAALGLLAQNGYIAA